MRNRGAVVLIEDGKLALIKRTRTDSLYYVFPGGGIKEGETPEAAAKREALEELGVEVDIKELFAEVERGGRQYFYLAKRTGGSFGEGSGIEYSDGSRNRGTYLPVWVELADLAAVDVKPRAVAVKIREHFKK